MGDWTFDFPSRSDPCRNESTWRASTILARNKLKKTDAEKMYPGHLRPDDLPSLVPEVHRYPIPGKLFLGKRQMYKEREVERCAWRKYGGPAHFERFLRKAFNNYSGRGAFQYPPEYRHALRNNPQFVAQDVQPARRILVDYNSLSPAQQVVFDMTGSL
ncbi:hypothetical protein FA13DRAFT_1792944 [Coprinellus micaceus]|uniref:Uncharacterized protein n=1 Tax=Coprinellus micaceus TaxID=71717 RepID=A0A4Y7T622_COPMI|nr:hypothetical protein FA13DRAFT_1792944 [Coprinellus micaceus]